MRVPESIRYRRWPGNRRMIAALREHPRFLPAVIADTRFLSARRGRPLTGASRARVLLEALRLAWETDSFAAQIAWRARGRLLGIGVPLLPTVLHHFMMIWAQVSIGEGVVGRPGINIAHGQVCIAGLVEIGKGTLIPPQVSIGLVAGDMQGPTIGENVRLGTGCRILGPITIGDGAAIGSGAVVLEDVPAGATAVGVPARVIRGAGEEPLPAETGISDDA